MSCCLSARHGQVMQSWEAGRAVTTCWHACCAPAQAYYLYVRAAYTLDMGAQTWCVHAGGQATFLPVRTTGLRGSPAVRAALRRALQPLGWQHAPTHTRRRHMHGICSRDASMTLSQPSMHLQLGCQHDLVAARHALLPLPLVRYCVIVFIVELLGVTAVLPYGFMLVRYTETTSTPGLPTDDGKVPTHLGRGSGEASGTASQGSGSASQGPGSAGQLCIRPVTGSAGQLCIRPGHWQRRPGHWQRRPVARHHHWVSQRAHEAGGLGTRALPVGPAFTPIDHTRGLDTAQFAGLRFCSCHMADPMIRDRERGGSVPGVNPQGVDNLSLTG